MEEKILKLIEEKYKNKDFLKYHIVPVVKNAMGLAKKLKADEEVVEMGAYLHDISNLLIEDYDKYKKENEHHILGAEKSKEFLKEQGYGDDFIEKVVHCVLAHGGRAEPNPETLEAEIVACADAMAHFDTFLRLTWMFIESYNTTQEAIIELENKIQRDWNKKLTLPEAKEIVKEKYEAIMLLIKSMKEYI